MIFHFVLKSGAQFAVPMEHFEMQKKGHDRTIVWKNAGPEDAPTSGLLTLDPAQIDAVWFESEVSDE